MMSTLNYGYMRQFLDQGVSVLPRDSPLLDTMRSRVDQVGVRTVESYRLSWFNRPTASKPVGRVELDVVVRPAPKDYVEYVVRRGTSRTEWFSFTNHLAIPLFLTCLCYWSAPVIRGAVRAGLRAWRGGPFAGRPLLTRADLPSVPPQIIPYQVIVPGAPVVTKFTVPNLPGEVEEISEAPVFIADEVPREWSQPRLSEYNVQFKDRKGQLIDLVEKALCKVNPELHSELVVRSLGDGAGRREDYFGRRGVGSRLADVEFVISETHFGAPGLDIELAWNAADPSQSTVALRNSYSELMEGLKGEDKYAVDVLHFCIENVYLQTRGCDQVMNDVAKYFSVEEGFFCWLKRQPFMRILGLSNLTLNQQFTILCSKSAVARSMFSYALELSGSYSGASYEDYCRRQLIGKFKAHCTSVGLVALATLVAKRVASVNGRKDF